VRRARREPVEVIASSGSWIPPAPAPSDAATYSAGRIYDVELHDIEDRSFHLRWGGEHAAAVLAALRHAHRDRGPIRQVEWGSYEAVLDGGAVRRLLNAVLPDRGWHRQPVEIVAHPGDLRPAVVARVGTARSGSVIALATVLELLEDDRHYSVLADVY
jgi:hypothetical protein